MLSFYNDNDLDVAALTVWGEARGEGEDGQRAVAWVIRNRAAQPAWWGRDVAGVCQRPSQFSCWNPGDPNSSKIMALPPTDPKFLAIRALVEEVFESDGADPTSGATHYKVIGTKASWDEATVGKPAVEIGHHVFYRLGPSA